MSLDCSLPGDSARLLDLCKSTYAATKEVISQETPYLNTDQPVIYNLQNKDPFFLDCLFASAEVEAVLRSRKLVPLAADEMPPEVSPLTAAERKYYLSATTHVDHDPKTFQEWLDAKKLRRSGLKPKTEALLQILRSDPFQSPPPFEKLVGDLAGAYSRRINIQHRLVYQVLRRERIVKVIRMSTHYE